jgi:ABC-type amino acid transport substrate-binding protein
MSMYEDGKIVGIDIARKIAERLGVDLEVQDMKFSALIEAVKRDNVDIVIADMAITPEREKQVLFSYRIKWTPPSSEEGANIRSIDDLRGKTVGVQVGTVQEDWAVKTLVDYSKIVRYDKLYPLHGRDVA